MTLPSFELPMSSSNATLQPFEMGLFRETWFDHLADKYHVQERHGNFVVLEKRLAKGLLSLRELKFYAGHTAWFHDLDATQVDALLALPASLPWDYFYTVWPSSRQARQDWERLQQKGFSIFHGWAKPMHMVDLRQGWEGYLARRNSKDRYNIRQKISKAHKAQATLQTVECFKKIDPFFEQFFALHVPYWQAKTGHSFFADPAERKFTVAWAKALFPTGHLRLHTLKIKGQLANLSFSVQVGGTLYWLLTINTGDCLDYYPGLVSLYWRLQEAAQEGIQQFNMGYGSMPYKIQLQTHVDPRNVLVIINPKSWKGHLFGAWFDFKEGLHPSPMPTE